MNDQVITAEQLAAAHTEALQLNDRHDFFAAAKQQGFSDTYTQAIFSSMGGDCIAAEYFLSNTRQHALAEENNRSAVAHA